MPRLRPAPDEKEEPKVEAVTPEVEVVKEPELEVEVETVEPEVRQDDATVALRKQIDDLRKSEQLLKDRNEQFSREREEALERARQRETQLAQVQKEAYDSQADAVSSALAAAQAEMAKARMDIKNSIDIGDSDGQAAALERQAIAAANLNRLQEGKEAIEARNKTAQAQSSADPIDTWEIPKISKDWIKDRRHLVNDRDKFAELQYYMVQARRAGLIEHTRPFLDYLEAKFGERPEPEVEAEPAPRAKGPIVSAPVSRDVPNSSGKRPGNGKVTLSPAEVEAARISGISPEEYAKQKIRKAEMIASGEYGEQK